jgi:arylsulfatase A-like enzyme
VDLFPTLAEMVGLELPDPASGRSLVPLMRGQVTQDRPILAMTYRPEAFTEKRAIIMDDYKFIRSWSDEREWEELYHLGVDPDELVDLIHDEPEIADRLRAALEERLRLGARTPADEAELSQQDLDRLQALGYVH